MEQPLAFGVRSAYLVRAVDPEHPAELDFLAFLDRLDYAASLAIRVAAARMAVLAFQADLANVVTMDTMDFRVLLA